MNCLLSKNLRDVRPEALPPRRREGPARMLFLHGSIAGFRNVVDHLKRYAAERDDIQAVHIDLETPTWMRVLGKSLPVPGGWDFHSYRHLRMWRWVHRRWFRSRLPLDRFDVVHVITQGNAYAFSGPRRAAGDGPRVALNIDGTARQDVTDFGFSRTARAPFVAAERRMFAAADLIVCRNAWASRSLRDDFNVSDDRIHVARNSLAVPAAHRWEASRPDHDGPPRLVFVGTGWKRKGGDLVLAAHQRHLAGRAELHVVGARTAPDPAARNVVWHGYVPRQRLLDELLPEMDVFVLASRFDMLPWAALEGAAAGLPVVGPSLGGIPEVVVDGETGLLFEPGDEAALAASLGRLVEDAGLRRRLGTAGRRRVVEHFDPDRTYPALLDRLVELADESGTP